MPHTDDLFPSPEAELERLPIVGGELFYVPRILLPHDASKLLDKLIADVPWRAEQVTVWGKKYNQPRLIAWYGDEGRDYTYSGIAMKPLPWLAELTAVKNYVEGISGEVFNSVLLNYYRDERDGMGFHSDNEKELGPTPTIASVSLGQERTFVFKPKSANLKPIRLRLSSGSLLLMKGETQQNWKHGIEKETRPCGPRVNLTFRRIYR